MKKLAALLMCTSLLAGSRALAARQKDIPYMADWPKLPAPYRTRDWHEAAQKVTLLMLDENAQTLYFPVTSYFQQAQATSGGYQGPAMGSATYLRADNQKTSYGEAVSQLAAILTLSMTDGMDARNLNGRDYVRLAQAYYAKTPDGRGFVSNNAPVDDCADSFWYTLYPTLLYCHLAAQYPEDEALALQIKDVADTWLDALKDITTWQAMGVSLKDRAVIQGGHAEPEGIFGAAYVLYMGYARFGEERYRDAALTLLKDAAAMPRNPYYEILGSYAPYLAARLNAEQNAELPLERMIDWVFTDGKDASRPNWGMMSGRFGEYDAYGLSGSLTDTNGYAFAMNTFVTAGIIAPVARYAPQYARAIGQYLTAVASNSHMFFGDGLAPQMQDDGWYVKQTGIDYLVYEGVRNFGKTTPYATGDAKGFMDETGTTFSFYSSGPMGLFSSIVRQTDVPQILLFDLLKTDFEHEQAYPTYLLYNPLDEEKTVSFDAGIKKVDIYDAVSDAFLAKNICGTVHLPIGPDSAVQAVLVPAGLEWIRENGRLVAGGITAAYPGEWIGVKNVQEGMVFRADTDIQTEGFLLPDTKIQSTALYYGDELVSQDSALPDAIPFHTAGRPAGEKVLRLEVFTQDGRKYAWAARAGVFEKAAEATQSFDGQALFALMGKEPHFKAAMGDDGLKLKVQYGVAQIPCPALQLDLTQNPYLLVDMSKANGAWGVECMVYSSTYTLLPDQYGAGIMICDVAKALRDQGVKGDVVEFRLRPYVTGGGAAVFKELTIMGGQ